ncbi:hypothetical protein ACROYT_G037554 [Oculina patagonica]
MTAEDIFSGPNGHQMVARALLDPASTASFVTERVVQRSKLCKQRQEITINGIGDTQCSTQSNSVVNKNLRSTQSSSALDNVQAIVLPSLTKCLPITALPIGNWPHLSTLKLADPGFNVSKPIDVLLGVDVYHDILKPGFILGPKGTPAAQATMFGRVLFGNTNTHQLPGLKSQHYMLETKQEAILLHHQLQDLFNRGGFKLHKWDSNSPKELNSISPEIRSSKSTFNLGNSDNFVKTLGLEYNCSQDHFKLSSIDLSAKESSITKREVLSNSAKIFDPLGLISCVTIVPKIIFQRLWERGTTWDEPLPPDIQREWLNLRTQPPEISAICIPRCYTPVGREIVDRQLIGFSDASEKAYCGVVYLRSFDTAGGVYTSLVYMAKTCVAPIKKVTLPRLELCGAHLLSQLMKHLQEILAIPTCKLYAFTDSTIVLYWIYRSSQRFKTFEANRIGEIQESVPPEKMGLHCQ